MSKIGRKLLEPTKFLFYLSVPALTVWAYNQPHLQPYFQAWLFVLTATVFSAGKKQAKWKPASFVTPAKVSGQEFEDALEEKHREKYDKDKGNSKQRMFELQEQQEFQAASERLRSQQAILRGRVEAAKQARSSSS